MNAEKATKTMIGLVIANAIMLYMFHVNTVDHWAIYMNGINAAICLIYS